MVDYYDAFRQKWATLSGTDQERLSAINTALVSGPARQMIVPAYSIYNLIVPSEFSALSDPNKQLLRDIFSLGEVDVSVGTQARSVITSLFQTGASIQNLAALAATYDTPQIPWWQANGYLRPFDAGDVVAAKVGGIVHFGTVSGAWSWFGEPRAARFVGDKDITYFGTITSAGVVTANAYDHGARTLLPPAALATIQEDDHGSPTMLIRPDGKLLWFYSRHDGTNMYVRKTNNAEDISSFGAEIALDTQIGDSDYTYPNPVQLNAEANAPIYLIYRGADGSSYAIYCTVSLDLGASWSPRIKIFSSGAGWPYFKVLKNGEARIDFFATDMHPDQGNSSIYHWYYLGGNYYKSNGTLIGTTSAPLVPASASLVYDGRVTSGWVWDATIDGSGSPALVYARFASITDHRYNRATWNGSIWINEEIAGGGSYLYLGQPHYSAGVSIDKSDVNAAYCAINNEGMFSLWKYTKSNGSWTGSPLVPLTSTTIMRPYAPRNASPDLQVLYLMGSYASYTNFSLRAVA